MSETLGFVGLGVMGSRMCANLVRRSGTPVVVYDAVAEAVSTAVAAGALPAGDLGDLARRADVVFLSLPSIAEVEQVCDQLLAVSTPPRLVVDMSTSDVTRTRALGERLAAAGVDLVDAPVARRRQAAEEGTLLITVGTDEAGLDALRPWLSCMGSDLVAAGALGNGQVLKILNNMVLFLNTHALAEALTLARRAGVDGTLLFDSLGLGSADSFALRTTARQTMLPDEFPEQAFPVHYAIKDLDLALSLARDAAVPVAAADAAMAALLRVRDAGLGADYYPVMIKAVDGRA